MLIENYELTLSTPDCDLESSIYSARVEFDADIGEVLPYVNAAVEKGEFIPGIPVLVWKEGAHRYALRPHEIAVSNVTDRREANELVAALVARINSIWEDREKLEPSFATYDKPKVLDVYKLLPRSNCRECGLPTCMAYAARLVEGKATLEECPPLGEGELSDALGRLRDLGL